MIIYFITCGFKKYALEKQYFDLVRKTWMSMGYTTFIRNTFRPDFTALSSKVNSFSLMIALLSLSPVYVTT